MSSPRRYGCPWKRCGRAVKKQWAAADKAGARFGVMLAPRELAAGHVVLKDLTTGEQTEVRREKIAARLVTMIRK